MSFLNSIKQRHILLGKILMNEKLVDYIEKSFLSPLLEDKEITDISFNGVSIFFMHNTKGRMKSDISLTNEKALDFIRQIANLSERQFSYSNPNLDVSVSKYRINAVHPSIVRVKDEKGVSFAIRIASDEIRISNNGQFMSFDVHDYLMWVLKERKSIVIGGTVGCGKTELQKYLITCLKENTRLIIIDDVQELDYLNRNENVDITCWQIPANNQNTSMNELIRIALRSNPDWLIVAESRGKEMNELLNSVMTGHPIITTVHAKTVEYIPQRMARMVEMAGVSEKHEDILMDIYDHFEVFIYCERCILENGNVERYIKKIGEIDSSHNMRIIYERN